MDQNLIIRWRFRSLGAHRSPLPNEERARERSEASEELARVTKELESRAAEARALEDSMQRHAHAHKAHIAQLEMTEGAAALRRKQELATSEAHNNWNRAQVVRMLTRR
jgi:hypothetical protein